MVVVDKKVKRMKCVLDVPSLRLCPCDMHVEMWSSWLVLKP